MLIIKCANIISRYVSAAYATTAITVTTATTAITATTATIAITAANANARSWDANN